MIITEIAGKEDMDQIRKLWERSFDDQKTYIDYYFSDVTARNHIFVVRTGSRIVSMVHLNPYTLVETDKGRSIYKKGGYIVGVATDPEFRRQGIMSMLMRYVLAYAEEHMYDYIYLMPEKEVYYKHLGFVPVVESGFYNVMDIAAAMTVRSGIGQKLYGDCRQHGPAKTGTEGYVYRLCRLEDVTDAQLQIFTDTLSQKYSLFARRDRGYLEDLRQECRSLSGDLYIIMEKEKVAAVYGTMYDGEQAEIAQYCTTTDSLDPLLYGIKKSGIRVFPELELFGHYSGYKKIKKGHGIMFYEPALKKREIYKNPDRIFINEVV